MGAIAAIRNAAAERLLQDHGKGHWSGSVTDRGVVHALREKGRLLVAREGPAIVATLRLATKKPWAVDPAYFTKVTKALYLVDMAVLPNRQRSGIGRWLLAQAVEATRQWPADALRLDAYDAAAGAGEFYGRCGFRNVGRTTYRGTPLAYYEWLA